ncbi:CitS [Paenibacillus mucilaginosus 3016]|uniref:histidine kinase n=2 Tax=Paenibacillus mucilaginosus TaxID=61624 RepID=H6NRG4_9BACL|nr:GHKL domain-containing protein [Paenibacillus mucilaginosus]AFC33599.1 CitS [Paenibacillus mucilaginosus 3016]AFH65924.1 CitS protein [Paenibacillus mucilaginosus K02]WFA21997.1 GHKL domain-containing protein [Paenibacillus mucilaginosus]
MLRAEWFNKSKFIVVFVVVFFSTILLNNFVFYQVTQERLEETFEKESEMLAVDLTDSISQYHLSVRYVEELIGEELRVAAMAIQSSLDPKFENVTNEQLAALSQELGISHITLFQRKEKDIVGVRSSDPKEIGISARKWGFWYTAMKQLFALQPVSIPEGQKLKNYWAGPLEYSSSNPGSIDKWGYYYDGTTNYMINPYVHDRQIREFQNLVGYEEIVQRTLKKDSTILEITGFNPKLFGEKAPEFKRNDGTKFVSLSNRDIYFGTYTFPESRDVASVRQAISDNRTITYSGESNGRKVIKSFIPVPSGKDLGGQEFPYVIGVVSDYQSIQTHLDKQARNAFYLIILATLMAMIIIYLYVIYMRRAKESAVQLTQDQYIEDISRMFTTVRGQRHDFLNHVQTIHTMVQLGKYEEVKKYTKQFVQEIVEISDIIQINHPVIASQVQAKVAASISRKIRFQHDFQNLCKLPLNALKSVDMVKVIGNLVDNAFDEVEKLPVEEREVLLTGWVDNGDFHIKVKNPCHNPPSEEEIAQLFKPGFSTKEGEHHGLGLSIVKGIVEGYKGSIQVAVEGSSIEFHVRIPGE